LLKLAKKMRKSLEVDVLTDDTAEPYHAQPSNHGFATY
jgi:hypothetical protein